MVEEETIQAIKDNNTEVKGYWKGKIAERKECYTKLHEALNNIYGKETELEFSIPKRFHLWRSSGDSHYNMKSDTITLKGRLSLITYLHEYGHALGKGQMASQVWASSLFKTCYPERFAKLKENGDMFIR